MPNILVYLQCHQMSGLILSSSWEGDTEIIPYHLRSLPGHGERHSHFWREGVPSGQENIVGELSSLRVRSDHFCMWIILFCTLLLLPLLLLLFISYLLSVYSKLFFSQPIMFCASTWRWGGGGTARVLNWRIPFLNHEK